jgi:energy-coupling factor transporter ATP-binding protein EcfA2
MGAAELGESVARDLDIPGLAAAFRCRTAAGAAQLATRLQEPVSDPTTLEKRQEQLRDIKRRLREPGVRERVAAARATLERTEEAMLSLTTLRTDKRHSEYYTQILWSPESRLFSWLNEQSLFNEAVVFFRTLFLPGLALLLPLFVFLAPLLIYKFVLRQPLTLTQYRELLGRSLKQAMPSVLGRPRFAGRGGLMEVGEQAVHILVSAGVFVASIWNQISAARSMRTVVADMRERAAAAREFAAATRELGEAIGCPVAFALPEWPIGDLALFGACWNTPTVPTELLAAAGQLDMLVAVATKGRVCFPTYSADALKLTDLYHPGTGAQRVYNSITMDASAGRHVLLTGPNRGGKSTMLKSLGAAVLMSQTLGVVFARRATVPVFQQIITALAPADVLGEMSLFEAEIEFAKGVRQRLTAGGGGPMFLMMDEIFHGTNAHDGLEASRVFLDDLYGRVAWSIVSTHYLGLPEHYGSSKQAQTLCMEAARDAADPERLLYTYRLRPGINELSSVREILRERGLLEGRVPEPEKSSAPANKV